jgi:hypothetical protein
VAAATGHLHPQFQNTEAWNQNKETPEANANPSYGMTTSAQLSKFTNCTEKSSSRTIPSYLSRALKFQDRYQIGRKAEEISSKS